MSKGLVFAAGSLGILALTLLGWEFYSSTYTAPAQLARTMALAGVAALIGGLAWWTRV